MVGLLRPEWLYFFTTSSIKLMQQMLNKGPAKKIKGDKGGGGGCSELREENVKIGQRFCLQLMKATKNNLRNWSTTTQFCLWSTKKLPFSLVADRKHLLLLRDTSWATNNSNKC